MPNKEAKPPYRVLVLNNDTDECVQIFLAHSRTAAGSIRGGVNRRRNHYGVVIDSNDIEVEISYEGQHNQFHSPTGRG